MRKKSLKDLDKLERNGWALTPAAKEKIAERKSSMEMQQSAQKIAESIETLSASLGQMADSSVKMQAETTKSLTSLFNTQLSIIRDILSKFERNMEQVISANAVDRDREWEFNVKRNDEGFIKKIFAKQL